ncbi:class I SAM-dependent methyltransferase [Novipirellula artificiosorum]|uniref:Methyltransferase domain protein n=1 Tax=Novipirellula artificiosorum TaxID=2528016 RepID=A0A5C6DBX6_9BACT|nr:class I SAM-dependent methyltransferase [Novipirellula artificiosorum]TWU34208.1 Methyltransferase domain protein [Novipirellula artificiosorum]
MSAQDQTLDQYHELMQINVVSHLLRSARETGLLDELKNGQRTLEQLCESLSLLVQPTSLLLDALIAIGIVQKYGNDHALSPAAQLLCSYDVDLGDARWGQLADQVRGRRKRSDADSIRYFEQIAATQWIHTPAAIQAAEILNLGGEGEELGLSILDLGCGSAVWSCAMVHRDVEATITAVDLPGPLAAAISMAASIDVTDRFSVIESDPLEVDGLEPVYDIVLLAQRLFGLGEEGQIRLLEKAVSAIRPGGRLVVIDLFRGPTKPSLAESVEALKLELDTPAGGMKTLKEAEAMLGSAGLGQIQFSFLVASRIHLGMMVAVR